MPPLLFALRRLSYGEKHLGYGFFHREGTPINTNRVEMDFKRFAFIGVPSRFFFRGLLVLGNAVECQLASLASGCLLSTWLSLTRLSSPDSAALLKCLAGLFISGVCSTRSASMRQEISRRNGWRWLAQNTPEALTHAAARFSTLITRKPSWKHSKVVAMRKCSRGRSGQAASQLRRRSRFGMLL